MQTEDDIEPEPSNNPNPSEISTSGVKVDSSGTSNSDNEPNLDDESSPSDEATSTGGSSPGDEATSTGESNPKELRDHDYNIIGCKNFMQRFVNNRACLDSIRDIYIYIYNFKLKWILLLVLKDSSKVS
jgi:hypothetical protein